MKRVLVTGGTGFIGRHVLPLLVRGGYEVHAISSKPVPLMTDVFWHSLDLFKFEDTDRLVRTVNPTHLLHLAWNAIPGKFWTSIDNLAWVESSLHLIRSFEAVAGERLVVAGTCAEYDWKNSFCSENGSFHPSTLYGVCKRSLYQILESFAKIKNFTCAWGYIFFLFGPGEYPNRFVPSVIRGLLQEKEVPCSHGNQLRDFLDVRDVASAFVALLDSELTGGVNIASGSPVTLKEISQKISSLLERPNLIKYGAFEPSKDEPLKLIADTRRLQVELGWSPKFKLSDSINDSIDWWRDNLALT